jgi:cytoskeleton protein RodZ
MPEIGAMLQEARMRAGIDISEVEAATKIRAKYLRAIENEEWDMLPGPTFVKSFLRTYADYLGIDGKLLVEEYKLRHEPPPVEAEVQPMASLRGESRRLRAPRPPRLSRGWIVGLSVVGLLALLIVLGSIGAEDEEAPVSTEPARTRPAPRPRPRPRPVATRVNLSLQPTEDVYVCLRDAAGELIVNETLGPDGGTRTFSGTRFRVTVGRAAIRIRVNGQSVPVPDTGEPVTYELKPRLRELLPGVNACEPAATAEG